MALTQEQLRDKLIELKQKEIELEEYNIETNNQIQAKRIFYKEAEMREEIKMILDSRKSDALSLSTEINKLKKEIQNA